METFAKLFWQPAAVSISLFRQRRVERLSERSVSAGAGCVLFPPSGWRSRAHQRGLVAADQGLPALGGIVRRQPANSHRVGRTEGAQGGLRAACSAPHGTGRAAGRLLRLKSMEHAKTQEQSGQNQLVSDRVPLCIRKAKATTRTGRHQTANGTGKPFRRSLEQSGTKPPGARKLRRYAPATLSKDSRRCLRPTCPRNH